MLQAGRGGSAKLSRCGSLLHAAGYPRRNPTGVQTRLAGFAQSEAGQSDCYSCDNIENSYQEDANATACTPCALGTQRYTGVLNATTKRACQCKPGNTHLPRTIALGRRCSSFELPLLPSCS